MNYWSLPMTSDKISLGDGSNANKTASLVSRNVLLDSGLSYSLVPKKDVDAVAGLLLQNYGISCKRDEGEVKERGSSLAFYTCWKCS
mmetsp:Transcript_20115/g.30880  ORF Transcript_20115/g.30880 Transcript_20115/m.30880 type:complete len:87 (+) Transcript_20115:60-320(+)|eukprot:CAMPEP_0170504574 /NCGR_PEP_ID=MMETSP0208-20121228/48304_1 /TAXON_ID=197538 /ORGANISM="Strombidium inclinatum, Strain S3" /LENGTH=86 /DNA_ID=CAMNT_0010784905 /DNA_START=39 /DNA_END=299 /DNA_ORIENTATION=+